MLNNALLCGDFLTLCNRATRFMSGIPATTKTSPAVLPGKIFLNMILVINAYKDPTYQLMFSLLSTNQTTLKTLMTTGTILIIKR